MTYAEDTSHVARVRAKAFLLALEPKCQALWRSMPSGWTPMMDLLDGQPQGTVSGRLARLHEAHFVERRAKGKLRLYRPRRSVALLQEVVRGKPANRAEGKVT